MGEKSKITDLLYDYRNKKIKNATLFLDIKLHQRNPGRFYIPKLPWLWLIMIGYSNLVPYCSKMMNLAILK